MPNKIIKTNNKTINMSKVSFLFQFSRHETKHDRD